MEDRVARLQAMAGDYAAPSRTTTMRTGGSVPRTAGRGPWG
jgi:hypothetical protein